MKKITSTAKPRDLPWLREEKGDVLVSVHVQPRASRNEICSLHGDRLKIRIQAPPVDGAANAACQKILAKRLKVPKSSIILKSGTSSRQKIFRIKGISFNEAERILQP